jgi:hypothetical protein
MAGRGFEAAIGQVEDIAEVVAAMGDIKIYRGRE